MEVKKNQKKGGVQMVKILSKINTMYYRIIMYNYEYSFVNMKMKKLLKENCKSNMILGLSYATFGLQEEVLKHKYYNLSLPSQDLYYSFAITRKILEDKHKDHNIEHCILGVSYYSLFFDLSRTKNEIYRINTYIRILNDSHNCAMKVKKLKICTPNLIGIFSHSYFNLFVNRKNFKLTRKIPCKLNHKELSDFGKERAEIHNNLFVHKWTLLENTKILKETLKLLNEYDINPIIVIFPAMLEYREFLEDGFKKIFYETMEQLEDCLKYEILDLFDSTEFDASDFIDLDHLNAKGAIKVSKIINSIQQ